MKRIAILGSTGSIGGSALSVASAHADQITVVGLAAGNNVDRLVAQAELHRPSVIAMASPSCTPTIVSSVRRSTRSHRSGQLLVRVTLTT